MLLLSDNRITNIDVAGSVPPEVSVVIPAYQAEATIRRALASVAAQSFSRLEVIVVDDGGGDRTAEFACNILRQADLPHVVVRLLKNSGPSLARNIGVSLARGKYVAFLDADDIWMPAKLALQTQLMDRHPEVTLCGGQVERYDTRGIRLGPLFRNLPSFQAEGWKRLLWHPFIHTSSAMVRRLDLGAQPFDTRLRVAEDRDLWIRLARQGSVALVQQVVTHKLEAPTSFMATNRRLIASDTKRMVEHHVDAMRHHISWRERMAIYGSLHSQIGKGLAGQPGRYLAGLAHLMLAIASGFHVFDNARCLVLSAPVMRAIRVLVRRRPVVGTNVVRRSHRNALNPG